MQDKQKNVNFFPTWLTQACSGSLLNVFSLPHKKRLRNQKIAKLIASFLQHYPTIDTLNFRRNRLDMGTIDILNPLLKAQSSLTSIDFSKNEITDEMVAKLSPILKSCAGLTHLNFNLNQITQKGIRALSIAFDNNTILTKLSLAKNQIDSEGLKALSYAFRNNSSLHLNFSSNPIGSEGAEVLARDLKHKKITKLLLVQNQLDDKGIVALSVPLQQHLTITKLQVSRNKVGMQGANALRLVLENNVYIEHIDFSGNEIDDAEALLLAQGLKVNRHIKTLNLSFNPKIKAVGTNALMEALTHHPTLYRFSFAANHIGDSSGKSIYDLLTYNRIITALDLNSNDLTAQSGHLIALALEKNQVIKECNLSYNPIGDDAAILLASAIKYHRSIQNLSLKDAAIGTRGVIALAQALETNQTLIHFQLDHDCPGDDCESDGSQALINALKVNPQFISLEFRCKNTPEAIKQQIQTLVQNNLQSMHQIHANQFINIVILLARDKPHNQHTSLWSLFPPEIKQKILASLCLSLSLDKKFGKNNLQLQQVTDFIFNHINEINQHIHGKKPIKIIENITKTNMPNFSFFSRPLKRAQITPDSSNQENSEEPKTKKFKTEPKQYRL